MKYLFKLSLIIFCLIFAYSSFAATSFTDIGNSKYKESIISLSEKGIIEGYDDGTFKPDRAVNRAEMLKIIFASLQTEESEREKYNCFPDVKDEWFAPYICKAKDLEIVKGYPNGLYNPEQNANMAEALKIAIEAFDLPIDELQENEQWFEPYVNFTHRNNIFSKYAYFNNRPAKREEIAFLIDELIKFQKEEKPLSTERNAKSKGCYTSIIPASPPTKFMVNGVERSAITVIPGTYNPTEPIPLVFAFHGRTNSNQMVKGYYGIEKPANGQAIFVYPAGMPNSSGYSWSDPGDNGSNLRDYEFFDVMLETFENSYCINVDEVYAVGHSLGAWFTNSLACSRGDVLRAVGTLGGSRSNSACTGPVAAMQWHNPKDEQAPFSGALATKDDYLEQNQCSEQSLPIEPSWGNCREYLGCYEDAPVLFCPHNKDYDYQNSYYPHNWPKGTGEEMWKFFKGLD